MKSSPPAVDPGVDPAVDPAVDRVASPSEGGTRSAVARLLLEQGPCTAAAVAATLRLSAPAVRRHLDALLDAGEAEVRDAPRRGPRGRGRPAREYLLTGAGRARFGHGYDDLAVAALRYLAQHGGEGAVAAFADHRAAELLGTGSIGTASIDTASIDTASIDTASIDTGLLEAGSAGGVVEDRVTALARVLAARGYAAQIREVGAGPHRGVQLCQHHCPVAHVAAEFPELCEAETRAFAAVLGTHVQRLSTIARGHAACTTHVPLGALLDAPTTTPARPGGVRQEGSPA